MKSEISEIQRLNERLSRQAEQARKRAKKIAAGPRARCSIEKGPPSGNHRPMAFLVRIAAVALKYRSLDGAISAYAAGLRRAGSAFPCARSAMRSRTKGGLCVIGSMIRLR
jgi:hypothetical protein